MSEPITTSHIVLPIIHLNGTAPDRLIADLQEAADALDKAYYAIKQTAPNVRDYYLGGAHLMEAAEAQHYRRLRVVDELKAELDAAILAIDEGLSK